MSRTYPGIRSFLLEWLILHGDNWVYHDEVYQKDLMVLDKCRMEKFIIEEDHFLDPKKMGSYFKISARGRDHVSQRS